MKKQEEKTLPVRDTQEDWKQRDSVNDRLSVFENAFDPAANAANDLYGPPPFYDEVFDPEENLPEELYGPPPMFDRDDEKTIPVDPSLDDTRPFEPVPLPPSPPGDGFDPEDNVPRELYGPPRGLFGFFRRRH